MLARYREVCETVLKFRESKEKLVRRAVITLLPRLAAFAPERFVKAYLQQSCEHLVAVLGVPAERGAGFVALAEMATALARAGVAGRMKAPTDFLRPIAGHIREALLAPRVRARGGAAASAPAACPEALECVGTLAVALRGDWQPHVQALLDPMFQSGLSEPLVRDSPLWAGAGTGCSLPACPRSRACCGCARTQPRRSPTPLGPPPLQVKALTEIVGALPALLPRVQAMLLDLLGLALARKPISAATSSATLASLAAALAAGEAQGPAMTRLALATLGSFSFVPFPLLDFVRDYVLPFLDDNDALTRRAAALAACHAAEQHVQAAGRRRGGRLPGAEQRAVDRIVQRLLAAAVADPAQRVRTAILAALARTRALDGHLAQAESLHALFVALNDESASVRSLAIQLAGHISGANPAYVMPALRRHLMQLLADMDHSPDSRQREESARLLGVLIHAAPKLVLPYTAPVLKALITKLRAAAAGPAAAIVPVNGGKAAGEPPPPPSQPPPQPPASLPCAARL